MGNPDDRDVPTHCWPSEGGESQKWEPTQSDAPGRSPTQSECPRRSRAPRSTQSDDGRHPKTARNFPDTEEVTGSNPVRPTPFFEFLSSDESLDESQRAGVLSLRCWSEHPKLKSEQREISRFDMLDRGSIELSRQSSETLSVWRKVRSARRSSHRVVHL
jgi:hypothetical protein